jgi:hypothetical protein
VGEGKHKIEVILVVMSSMESRELERLRYRQGQTLRGVDFRDQRRIEDQLRAWHNRSLHNVYGVAKKISGGLKVKVEQDHVVVASGLAYDAFGSPLIRRDETRVPSSELTEPMHLVIRHKKDCGCGHAADPAGSCFSPSHSLVAEDTELVWLPTKNFSFRDGVPLARATVVNGVIRDDQAFVAPAARALARRRISSGTTIPGATTWEVSGLALSVPFTEVRVKIDTSHAGFTTVPEYFASLQGPLTSLDSANRVKLLCLHFEHLEKTRIDSFVFSFFIVAASFTGGVVERENQIQKFLNQQNAYVSWLAVERNPGEATFSA